MRRPGVPDFYQGLELFHYTLTDPDNRRPIDFGSRRALLSRITGQEDQPEGSSTLRAFLEEGDGGALKLYVTRNLCICAAPTESSSEMEVIRASR